MSTPPSRYSTPAGGHQAPRSASKAARSASYAPASSGTPSARAGSGVEQFLSPVSQLNRSKEMALKEQEERMKRIDDERALRLAGKHGSRMSTPAALASQSSAKRKLTELDATAAAASANAQRASSWADKPKKSRTLSPQRSAVTSVAYAATASGSESARRVTMHGGETARRKETASASLSAAALRRHDLRHSYEGDLNDRVSAATASDASERYLAYAKQADHMRQTQRTHAAMPSTPPRSHRDSSAGAQGLFARHADPSVDKTPPESTTSSPFKFPEYESSVSSTHGSPLPVIHTPPRHGAAALPVQLIPRGDDGMVDLDRVSTVSQLETVEGDDIYAAMMKMVTPRVGRHFPSEEARTASEEREIQFLRRRRLGRKSIDKNTPVVTKNLLKTSWEFDQVLDPVTSPSTGAIRRRIVSKEAQQARDDAENAKAYAAENDTLIDDDDDDDEETTESKVERFSQAKHWSLRRFLVWMVVGASAICALDVGIPLLLSLFAPPQPFCDGNTSLIGEVGGEDVALTLAGDKSEFTALQPYRNDCRACPLFGVCSKGALVSCLPPLEERNGACVESKEVQYALEQIARSIEKFVVDKAAGQVCGSPQLPSSEDMTGSNWGLDELSTARVVVLLSELKVLVLNSPFAETLMNISFDAVAGNMAAEFVFNRSLDLALSSFQKITQISFEHLGHFVGSKHVDRGDMLIQFSTSIAPWSCRARNQLVTHSHIIAIAVVLLAVSILLYRRWLVYKTERSLVDRLVKEVRFFLLGRLERSEKFYPANHLRDNLFDTLPNVSPRDCKWLRESVWPKVVTLVGEDSRVQVRIAPIHGKQMVVWEWISSNSPNVKVNEKRKLRARNARKRYSI